MQTRCAVDLLIGLLLAAASSATATATETDQIVGAVSPSGDAYLVKCFNVDAGAVITGVEFVNNDPHTVFPRVLVLRGPATRISEARQLREFVMVRPVSDHRVRITFPPMVIDAPQELFVAVGFPPSDGVRGVGAGAGLGASQLAPEAPKGCFFTTGVDALFGAMDVDYRLDLLFLEVGKATITEEKLPVAAYATLHPNPFNPSVTIEFGLPETSSVTVRIYDVSGRLVATPVGEEFDQGVHLRVWDGRNQQGRTASAGIYFARIQIGQTTITNKLVLAK